MPNMQLQDLPDYEGGDGNAFTYVVSDVGGAPTSRKLNLDSFADTLWDKMYIKAKSVIIQCRYCNSHNAISNPTCVQCGAPMGGSTDGR